MPRVRPSRMILLTAALTVATAMAVPAGAQSDRETDDHTERHRRYMERLRRSGDASDVSSPTTTEAARDEVVRRFVERADGLIRDKNFRSARTASVLVKTDDPRLDADAIAALLTSFRGQFERFWPEPLGLLPYEPPSRVYLFWSYFKYNQLFTGKARFDEFRTTGHYRGFLDVVVVHTDGTPTNDLADVLIHEAAHQLVEQRVLGPDVSGRPWLSEGLAEYFAYTAQDESGAFRPGQVGPKSVWPFRDGRPGRSRVAATRRKAAMREFGRGGTGTIDGLLRADPTTFYSGDVQARYGASWALVHYLLHGEDGAHASRFAEWIRDDVRGGRGRGLVETLGVDRERLRAGFVEHLRAIDVR